MPINETDAKPDDDEESPLTSTTEPDVGERVETNPRGTFEPEGPAD
jgi:hypothetical protein